MASGVCVPISARRDAIHPFEFADEMAGVFIIKMGGDFGDAPVSGEQQFAGALHLEVFGVLRNGLLSFSFEQNP